MPWLETDVREQRIKFVMEAGQPGANRRALCATYGISPPTGYKWLHRVSTQGSLTALAEPSRRPHHSPRRTGARVTARVVALRQEFGWAGRKLRPLLEAEGLRVATATIDRIIRREGLTHRDETHRRAPTRFERSRPNDLWQMDFKGQYPLRPAGWCFPLTILDDHSRYAVGLVPLAGTAGTPVQRALTRCFQQYGVPAAMLVDHGSPWWSYPNGHGLTRLAVFLLQQGIELLYSGVGHPQTQGKVERFHRTLGARLRQWGVPDQLAGFAQAFRRFRTEYNEIRPHEARGLEPPALHYAPSPRAFQPRPVAWPYPAPMQVVQVDRTGSIRFDRRRYFVCQALADEWVGCQVFDHHVLVTYRHMHVREVDLRSGRTTALVARAT
jgi:transposase InsO family protein